MKRIALIILSAFMTCMVAEAVKMNELNIVIDPGHGGYDGDDRGMDIWPYCVVTPESMWESKSNLWKALHAKEILDSIGTKITLTRLHNTYNEDPSDDIPDEPSLSARANVANNLGADAFFSIHSNAGETVNYPLMIYHEQDYAGNPRSQESVKLAGVVNNVFNTSKYSNWINYKGQINTEAAGRVTGDRSLLGYSLGVLRNCYVTSMLSEGGMHEHRPQAHRLMSQDYCWLEAWYFVQAIMDYFETEDRFVTGNVAGVIYDDHNIRDIEYTGKYARNTMLGRDKNMPLNGAYVELLDEAGNIVQQRITDKDYNGVFVFRNIAPGKYTVRATKDGFYEKSTPVEVVADKVTYQDMPLLMKRETPLAVVSYHPNVPKDSLVGCGDRITLEFNYDLNVEEFEKAFKIEPAVDGYFEYEKSYHIVHFIPTITFAKSTDYTVTIGKSACSPDTIYANSTMAEDFVFNFTTMSRERLEVIANYPIDGGSIHYAKPALEFRFDLKLSGGEALDHIKVYDKDNNELAVNKRTTKYNQLTNGYGNLSVVLTNNLTVGETYRAVLSGALRDAENLALIDDVEVTFTAKDEGIAKDGEMLEKFETAGLFAYNVDETVGITNTTPKYTKNTTDKLFDTASGKFSYNFSNNRDGVVVWDYAGESTDSIAKGDVLGLHVYGDFNNHELYVGVTSGTDTKYEKVCDMTFKGWGYYEVTMNSLEAGMPYKLTDVKLVQVTSPITQSGSFSLDNIVLKRADVGGVEAVEISDDAIKVYPVPADDVIYVESSVDIEGIEIISVRGVKVAENVGKSSINVENLPQGVYLMRVKTEDGVTLRRVAVSR